MKVHASAAGALVLVVTFIAACSSQPSHPPLDTTGTTAPQNGGSGGTNPTGDAGAVGDAAPQDAAITDGEADAADAASSCLFGTCAGCCTPPPNSQCLPGSVPAQCGSFGSACQVCTSTQTCTTTNGCQ